MTTTSIPAAKPADRPAIRAAMLGLSTAAMTTTTARPVAVAASSAPTGPAVAAYGLRQPTVVDARASIERIYGSVEADAIWTELTGSAVAARVAVSLDGIVDAMLGSRHDVVRLCGQALHIRVRSYAHLSAAQAIVS